MEQEMKEPAMPAGESTDGGNPASEAILGLSEALNSLTSGLEGAIPPEALKDLQMAKQSYESFISKAGAALGVKAPAAGQQPAEAMGAQGAVPADQPMGKNIRPVRA
jgi:hypothetical protein